MMGRRFFGAISILVAAALFSGAANPPSVKGTFVVGGSDAKLRHIRVVRGELDGARGKQGYNVVLTERESKADIRSWRSAEPAKAGSFLFLQFEPKGAIWIAELGHVNAKSGRFGVVTEIATESFKVDGGRLSAHIKTNGEQTFTQDHYTVDLTFDAPIEN